MTEAVTLSVPGVMELQLSPADTDAAAVRAQLEEQRRRLRAVLEGYGASGVEELEDMAAEADAAARLAEAAEARLAMALDGEGLDEVERAAAQLPESSRSERDVDADILALCKGADIGRFMPRGRPPWSGTRPNTAARSCCAGSWTAPRPSLSGSGPRPGARRTCRRSIWTSPTPRGAWRSFGPRRRPRATPRSRPCARSLRPRPGWRTSGRASTGTPARR